MTLPDSIPGELTCSRVKPSVGARLLSEFQVAKKVGSADTLLCFGNLPPLFRIRGRVVVFLQNRYLIETLPLRGFRAKSRLRLCFERSWFRLRAGSVDQFIVQTPSMRDALEAYLTQRGLRPKSDIRMLSFMQKDNDGAEQAVPRNHADKPAHEFVYVSSGEPHKNHRRLVQAWIQLAREGYYPSLALTIDQASFPDLCARIDAEIRQHGLKITNMGNLPHSAALELYRQSGALIFPSLLESFGLPLVEAKDAGLAIVAAELDYVRDVVSPHQTFDPQSSISIARAVKRFLGVTETPVEVVDARTFIDAVMTGEV
jgi:glycosyltransferase involved in cell wall biosynthesis